MRGKRILVLGASGFLGLPLAKQLAAGNEVHGLGLIPNPETRADLEASGVTVYEQNVVRSGLSNVPRDYDYVFSELALTRAVAEAHPDDAINVNIMFVDTLLKHFQEAAGIVLGSTGNVYKKTGLPLHEASPMGPEEIYGLTKACGDLFAFHFSRAHGVPVCIVRYFYPYGPGDRKLRPLFNAIVTDKPLHADPDTRFNPIFISDTVTLTIAAADYCQVPARAINVGGTALVTRRDLAQLIGRFAGRAPRFSDALPEASRDPGRFSDGVLQRELLPTPRVSLTAGIEQFVRAELPSRGRPT